MLELNRFIPKPRGPPGSAGLCSIITSSIGTNQRYSDFMARRVACDLTTLFKPTARRSRPCTLNTIVVPMAMACSVVSDEGSSPTAVVGTGADGVAVAPSPGRACTSACTSALSKRVSMSPMCANTHSRSIAERSANSRIA